MPEKNEGIHLFNDFIKYLTLYFNPNTLVVRIFYIPLWVQLEINLLRH
ncbi:hypothetical protein EV143_101319 [Flavobacterium chryseum]|nr:hypothetical protein EV143_101319 [Flavobacterium sp. P3160]